MFTVNEIKTKVNETSKSIDSLFNYYYKGYINISELDFKCNGIVNTLFNDIYSSSDLTTSKITDYISDIKIKVYSELINLYKKEQKKKNKLKKVLTK